MNLKTKLADINEDTHSFSELYELAQQQDALIEVLVSLVRPYEASDGNKIYYSDKIDMALDIAKDVGYL